MSFVTYVGVTLRASAATSGAAEQDSAVTLPDYIKRLWVVVDKTAEANADNLLTVRLQCQRDSNWFDMQWEYVVTTGAVATAADTATNVTRAPNIVDASSDAAFTVVAYYSELMSNVVRVVSVSSGTAAANTFSVVAYA